jgi:16S rRNA C1402 N4-methylase RsmH
MDHNKDRCNWLVNESSVKQLSDVIKNYGEERNYYNIAKNIIVDKDS